MAGREDVDVETGDKTLRSFGSSRDPWVSVNGVWLTQEKLMGPW